MIKTDVLVIGGGPAGLMAASASSDLGADVILVDRNSQGGGQLIKQTHKFFGSKKQFASYRGIEIADILMKNVCDNSKIEKLFNTTVIGIYPEEDIVVAEIHDEKVIEIQPQKIIIATGAQEKVLAFENNDLPGVYGAGAVQTLMNEHGVRPGKSVLMVGAGNIGLIVSYQLLQAGVEVKAVIDAAPQIGGYLVHASKLRRMGIPIFTSHTIKSANGFNFVTSADIVKLDQNWNAIEESIFRIETDVICIAVGLSPLTELLWQAGCEMKYVGELGGNVPIRNKFLETSVPGIYVAGDAAGVEEASSAMVEGMLVGASAAFSLNFERERALEIMNDCFKQLEDLRSGPTGEKIRKGLLKVV